MKLAEIRTFLAVTEAGSMQGAADRLGLTQSAVSRLVQRLEAELGVELLDRETKPLALTADGARALGHARRVQDEVASLSDAFAAGAPPTGTIALGFAHALAFLAAAEPLAQVRGLFPGVTLRIVADWSPPLIEAVRRGGLEACVAAAVGPPPETDGLHARRLTIDDVVVVAARDAPIPANPELALLNRLGWVLHPATCSYRRTLLPALEARGLTPNIVAETFGIELQIALIARGAGLGLLPFRLVRGLPGAERLRVVPTAELTLRLAVWLVRPTRTTRAAPVLDTFETALTAALREPS